MLLNLIWLLAAMFDSARTGFDISIGLVGVMALWLGILKHRRARRHGGRALRAALPRRCATCSPACRPATRRRARW
jgi:hypothetical protein